MSSIPLKFDEASRDHCSDGNSYFYHSSTIARRVGCGNVVIFTVGSDHPCRLHLYVHVSARVWSIPTWLCMQDCGGRWRRVVSCIMNNAKAEPQAVPVLPLGWLNDSQSRKNHWLAVHTPGSRACHIHCVSTDDRNQPARRDLIFVFLGHAIGEFAMDFAKRRRRRRRRRRAE